MAVAADLLEAANIAQSNLFALWQADTLEAAVVAFVEALNSGFSEETPNNRPVGNWLAIIGAFAPTIEAFAEEVGSEDTLQEAIDYIYRFCKFSYYYDLISPAQKTAILTAYNAQFA